VKVWVCGVGSSWPPACPRRLGQTLIIALRHEPPPPHCMPLPRQPQPRYQYSLPRIVLLSQFLYEALLCDKSNFISVHIIIAFYRHSYLSGPFFMYRVIRTTVMIIMMTTGEFSVNGLQTFQALCGPQSCSRSFGKGLLATCFMPGDLLGLFFQPEDWGEICIRNVCRFFNQLHGIISQKTDLFNWITSLLDLHQIMRPGLPTLKYWDRLLGCKLSCCYNRML
jgi:hypothetical protein